MRSVIADARVQPVENLVTNPSFERVVSGTTIVRRNLATHPRADTAWTVNVGTGAAASLSFENSMRKATWTAQASSGSPQLVAGWGIAVTPGQVITVSVNAAASKPVRLVLDWLISGTWVSSSIYSVPSISNSTLSPSRIAITATVPSGINQLQALVRWQDAASSAPGNWIAGDRLLIELRPSPALPYFDGATTDNSTITYSWEGTAGASISVAKAGTIEVRRNFLTTPRSSSLWGSWAGTGGSSSITMQTGSGLTQCDQFARMTLNTPPSVGAQTMGIGTNIATGIAVTEGTIYSFGIYVRHAVSSGVGSARQEVKWFDSNNIQIGASVTANPTSAGIGVWQLLKIENLTAPAGAVKAQIFGGVLMASGQIAPAGITVDVTAGIAEASPVLGAYFDGEMTPDADLTPTWTGTANASVSTLAGVATPSTGSSGGVSTSRCFASWRWSQGGSTSLRNMPIAGGNVTYCEVAAVPVVPGQKYTMLATYYLEAAQSGTISADARKIAARFYEGSENLTSIQGPNTTGANVIRLVITIPANRTQLTFRLLNGTSVGNGDIWWDKLCLVQGVYNGPYLDGDMPGCVWRGTPHSSTSVGYPQGIA